MTPDAKSPPDEPHHLYGVNLAGADFGEDELPGTYGENYVPRAVAPAAAKAFQALQRRALRN
jgi:hypothetical protein